ncbi:cyclin-A2-4-like [Tripterygium wilfordii]|uniref:B-like cyclin n=1 Tax=Tripterygium wilfordii TaxID=458696 RepID=A0A7J7CZ73_TRIWF|nr:cyclin-A2-4 [Tripterygium wilfordii]XP_038717860.1 cyclin-A2-4 [Tripterygium wilfordii]KAF5739126.1 cyclin-A2-4-like [Tripterygium wilfordii]
MKKENLVPANIGGVGGRLTRARAAVLRASGQLPPLKVPTQQDQKRTSLANVKRAAAEDKNPRASGDACLQRKRKAVLQDVTNVCCENSYRSCFNANKIQGKKTKEDKEGHVNLTKVAAPVSTKLLPLETDSSIKLCQEPVRIEPKSEVLCSANLLKDSSFTMRECCIDDRQLSKQSSGMHSRARNISIKAEKCSTSDNMLRSSDPDFTDIDSNHKDPQFCTVYAPDIYSNLRVAELARRPYPNFMETTQRDVTQSMRSILVDWLVEVSEEYKLASDTLYLTVHLIDWFLSENYIERQTLQLLGITCMLIASKYEEICAPRVEEFCFITDNTYTRDQVLKMESQIVRYFGFQIFAPTTKTFLRRFLRAAQASYKSPSLELECLANYLAEMTLVDYSFLNLLPSLIAASAVFLSRWTLDQSSHPWNPTLEHYTNYKTLDLKTTVLAMQDLQWNTSGCPLNAIRMKYRQEKFKSVAALSSPKLLETLF